MKSQTPKRNNLVELNIFDRIAYSDLDTIRKANAFLRKNGFNKASSQQDLSLCLAEAIDALGEQAIPDLLAIHPDAALFATEPSKPQLPEPTKTLNDCGCTGDDGSNTNQPAQPKIAAPEEKNKPAFALAEYTPVIVIAGIVCITITALTFAASMSRAK